MSTPATLPMGVRAEFDRGGSAEVLEIRRRAVCRPADGEVLVRVHATGINPKDTLFRARPPRGVPFPRATGFDFVGTVLESGAGVTHLPPDTRVWGFLDGIAGGAAAEYVTVPAAWVAEAPRRLPAAQAACLPLSASAALQALRDVARVTPGEHVVVWGASGAVGRASVQIARRLGTTVTAVSRRMPTDATPADDAHGITHRTRDDLLGAVAAGDASSLQASVLIDAAGDAPWPVARALLQHGTRARRGHWVTIGPRVSLYALAFASPLLAALRLTPRLGYVVVRPRAADLVWLRDAADDGALHLPVARTWPLHDIRAAHHHAETADGAQGRQVLLCQ